jgi:hypothetical protein
MAAKVPPEEVRAWNEVSSPALMAGRGYDEAFMSMPDVDHDDGEPELVWPQLVAEYGPRLRPAIAELPAVQRLVMEGLAAGKSRSQLVRERGVSRQAIHKVFWAAVRALREMLGPIGR